MQKPLILEINDFTQEMADVVSKYSDRIPFSIMLDKISMIQRAVEHNAEMQYEQISKEYNRQKNAELRKVVNEEINKEDKADGE